jgi:tetratricopeptide (TPR) repeat protein
LWTNATDLAKFAIEVQLSLQGKSNKVLSKEMVTRMVTPFIESHVGLGFFIQNRGDAVYFGHGGADEGFRAELIAHKEKGYGAVVMVNSDNGDIIGEILRSIAQEYGWEGFLPEPRDVVTVQPEKLEGYTGRFLVNPDRVLTITRRGGRLRAEPSEPPGFDLFPVSDDVFIRREAELQYTFLKDAASKYEKLKIRSAGREFEAGRISDDHLVPYELLQAGRVAEAIEAYRRIKKEQPSNVAVAERRLNALGYSLLEQKKYREAIEILKVNAEFYPKSASVFDTLGEAYLLSGDRDQAIANYRRSLELDPSNANAASMLKKLQ